MNGREFSALFYHEVVAPLLSVPHCAGRFGSGSDVLGCDDELSQDHDWGCRLTLLVENGQAELSSHLEQHLPESFRGRPVRFPTTWNPFAVHQVEIKTPLEFAASRLGLAIPESPLQWLTLTGQSVLEIIAGPIFHDSDGQFTALRRHLGWYPEPVWLYCLAAGWTRVSQELALVGRTDRNNDPLGSAIIAARLARDLCHLTFLAERRWPPYPKWMGTFLKATPLGAEITGHLQKVVTATRLEGLTGAISCLYDRMRQLNLGTLTSPIEPFFARPYPTVSDQVAGQIRAQIRDLQLLALPPGLGSLEQWVDNVDVLSHPQRRALAAGLYSALTLSMK